MNYTFLVSEQTLKNIVQYKNRLTTEGVAKAGAFFKNNLVSFMDINQINLEDIPLDVFIHLLIQTKQPTIFAESQVQHNAKEV